MVAALKTVSNINNMNVPSFADCHCLLSNGDTVTCWT